MLKSSRLLSLVTLVACAFWLQACGRNFEPQSSCNFVQNGNMQRVSWNGNIPIKLYIHTSVPVEAYPAIDRAVKSYNDVLGRQVLKIELYGVAGPASPQRDGYSTIYWMNTWDADKPTEQARTTIYWSGVQIYEADVRLNDFNFDFYLNDSTQFSQVDLTSLLVHEFGHVLGLAHNPTKGSVMNFSLGNGQSRRTPEKVDIDSLKCEY